jgi:hypothetical protein
MSPVTQFTWKGQSSSPCPNVDIGTEIISSRNRSTGDLCEGSREYQLGLATAPADIGMFPVPPQARIDLAIVAHDLAKTEEKASKTAYTKH